MDTFAITEGIVPESGKQDGHDAEKASNTKLPEGANKFQRAIAAWRGNSFGKLCYLTPKLLGIGLTYWNLTRYRFDQYCRKVRRHRFGHCRSSA